jgi:uncharacterized protein YdhG (YjbR/CyaY superfamily)
MSAPTVVDYIAHAPARTRQRLRQLRAAIKAASPGITERISYQIPTFDLDGRRCLYIAGFEHHVSVYPVTPAIVERHGPAIARYRSGKGTLRFPLDAPLPLALVHRIIKTRIDECRATSRSSPKTRPAARVPRRTGRDRRGRELMPGHRIFAMSFARVYPAYVQKAERKNRTKEEVDQIICWLTGYSRAELRQQIKREIDFETFFAQAPALHPNRSLITGVVCGVRVEDVDDPLMQQIRWLDKLIDELAKGKAMEKILR